MKCPHCASTSYRKNGHRNGKQNYLCKNCGKQFLESALPYAQKDELIADINGHKQISVTPATKLTLESNSVQTNATDSLESLTQILQTILATGWLESPVVGKIIKIIHQQLEIQNNSVELGSSLLLLDVENLKISLEVEVFLASICQYPLTTKIGFANWKNPSVSKHDVELYERGYQLIHVPDGKDGADAKMIAIGASILRSYPSVKEVLVCSGDGILTHLCNQLQNQGLTVYWVRRQGQILHIENRQTGKDIFYHLSLAMAVPSLEDVVQKIESLIKAEQESIEAKLNNLVEIATLFQERCHLEFNEKNSVKSEKNLSSSSPDELTQLNSTVKAINSQAELENLLIDIINNTYIASPTTKLTVSKLGSELRKTCGKSPNAIIKELKLGSSFTKFLQSSPKFSLKLSGKEYEITRCQ